ncbi:hypothetical protein Y1Q_0023042 [Alligator mississippiensis]|uniref:Uncharacterized protein n=1 Tax=Alligator mississippiensis TaxID=8496 RepID=A0A151P7I6_ALLMI|nr:hypothetical protein Y1Q_0023042 [Alligator mississippiensis]
MAQERAQDWTWEDLPSVAGECIDGCIDSSDINLQSLISHFTRACEEFGLTISIKMTSFMGQNIVSPSAIPISENVLDVEFLGGTKLPMLTSLNVPFFRATILFLVRVNLDGLAICGEWMMAIYPRISWMENCTGRRQHR